MSLGLKPATALAIGVIEFGPVPQFWAKRIAEKSSRNNKVVKIFFIKGILGLYYDLFKFTQSNEYQKKNIHGPGVKNAGSYVCILPEIKKPSARAEGFTFYFAFGYCMTTTVPDMVCVCPSKYVTTN